MSLLASIPSPSSGTIDLGPITLHIYGVLLAIGVIVASMITERRWKRWGHDPKQWQSVVVVIVIFGVIGARLYHVATDYELFEDHWNRVFEIWKGGLSIWGVVIGGLLGLLLMCRVRRVDALALMDAIVPGLLLAQAIGRFGNYFNQELFGEPTKLPWGLEIDLAHRPRGFERFSTFHPTFLYESLYCLLVLVVLLRIERHARLKRGQLAALYVVGYTAGRFGLENLRIDNANLILGYRVNAWVSVLAFVAGLVWFWWLGRHSSVDEGKYRSITPESTAAGA
jgi:prolipoprotein diacylglyceryl transferase